MADTALQRQFPRAEALPRTSFANLPTDIEPLTSLGAELGLEDLWVKRDDRSGSLYGGNKVRKLEFLLGEALAEGHDEVWTVGAIGSHHVLATCIYARQQGLEPGALHFPQPVTEHVLDNLRALSTTQPDLTLVSNRAQIPVEVLRTRVREWLARHPEVYYIPAGGSSATGALGYVNAALELVEQIEDGQMPEPDTVFVAAGTCGTLAGLTLGLKLAGLSTRVVGVRVVDRLIANKPLVMRLAGKMATRLEASGVESVPSVCRDDFELIHSYFGPDYGEPTPEGRRAIRLADQTEGLTLEPTYTGKTMAALIGERQRRELRDKTVLYWHTLSGVDLSERIAAADVQADLPDEYQAFFEGKDQT
jgi:1-aminocyclopropane-1-carboxylate deaminase/D-cysteine desulfhydrase-like pyridoxal-dependent ACC family enzyme